MSYTEIYKFNKDGTAEDIGEVRNAFRGAMAVWNSLEKKYLPKYVPEWAKHKNESADKEYSRMSGADQEAQKEIWDIVKHPDITETHKIAMNTTFDNVVVKRKNLKKLIKAFREFEFETSLKEQADLIEVAMENDPDMLGIAWNQTSVNGDTWTNSGGYDEETEESIPYNLLKEEKHWFLFDEM
jgi:hypothetical protein